MSDLKQITYNRANRDYDATYDGEYIGSFGNHHDAEVELDRLALDLAKQAARCLPAADEVYGICESCTMAKANSAFTTVLNAQPGGPIICDACLDALPMDLLLATRRLNELNALPAATPAAAIEARTSDASTIPSVTTTGGDAAADNDPASDCWPDEPIGDCALDGKPAYALDEALAAPLCPDHKAQERTWIANRAALAIVKELRQLI